MSDGAPAWVGIDLGTQSVRVVAIDDSGHVLATAARPLTSRRDGVIHEQDPAQWWSAVRDGLLAVTSSVEGHLIRALAVSATSGTVVAVDDRGRPVNAGVMYDDARGAGFTDEVNRIGARVWSRLGYRMQGSWALPTVLALAADGVLPPGRTIVHQPDLITARLTGHPTASDSSHALKTGFDLDALEWPHDVMDALGVPDEVLPAVVASGSVLGTVDAPAASDTGLPEGCAVVAGMTDGCAAQLAAGALAPGSWNSVLGTTLVVKGASTERHPDATGAVYAHRAPFEAGWFPGGASSTGAGAVSHWLPGLDLGALTGIAAGLPATVAYPLVGRGERFPFVAPDARAFFGGSDRSAFSSEPPRDDAGAFAAIVHGVAYVERLSYDLLDLAGYDIGRSLSFTGGGARNTWWNGLRCDLLQREVTLPARGEGAFGMAVLAAAAMDDTTPPDQRLEVAASRLLPAGTTLEPRPAPGLVSGYRSFLDELSHREWIAPELYHHSLGRAG